MTKSSGEAMIVALNKLRESVYEIITDWEECNLNDTESIADYPFDKSMDELYLYIDEWCYGTIAELKELLKVQK